MSLDGKKKVNKPASLGQPSEKIRKKKALRGARKKKERRKKRGDGRIQNQIDSAAAKAI